MCYKLGIDFRQVRQSSDKIKKIIPFSSDRKRMTIIYEAKEDRTTFRIYTKGAPELILDKCTHFFNNKGQSVILNGEYKNKINTVIKSYAN